MIYGLYDGDLNFYKIPFFNLELMKIATYYKNKKEIVSLSTTFNPEKYSKFIVRQDFPILNPYSQLYTNVSYDGRAFDGLEYNPLPPDIECCKPDTTIYNRIKKTKDSNKYKLGFNIMQKAEHIRLSLDGKTIWKDWEKQVKWDISRGTGIIFHDYDLGSIEGAFDLIQNCLPQIVSYVQGRRIGMKFPTIVNSEKELLKWLTFLPSNQFFSLQYNGILTLENLEEIVELKRRAAPLRQTTINITGNIDKETFTKEGIIQVLKTILVLRSHHAVFPLIYDKDFFAGTPWNEVLSLLQTFNNHILRFTLSPEYRDRVFPYETLYGYVKKRLDNGSLDTYEMYRIFQFVRENNYELFKMFYEFTGQEK